MATYVMQHDQGSSRDCNKLRQKLANTFEWLELQLTIRSSIPLLLVHWTGNALTYVHSVTYLIYQNFSMSFYITLKGMLNM